MTLPSRHRIRNSSPGGPWPRTLPLGHSGSLQYGIFLCELRRNMFFFETWMPERGSNPRSLIFQAVSIPHYTDQGPRPSLCTTSCCIIDVRPALQSWILVCAYVTAKIQLIPSTCSVCWYREPGADIWFLNQRSHFLNIYNIYTELDSRKSLRPLEKICVGLTWVYVRLSKAWVKKKTLLVLKSDEI